MVIHIKDAPINFKSHPDYVYIGRGSKWGNPFQMANERDRDRVCDLYEEWFDNSELKNDLHELRGKTLVCFCKPKRCHGDYLMRLIAQMEEESDAMS